MIYNFFKKVAFSIDAEKAHCLAISSISKHPSLFKKIFNQDSLNNKYEVQVGNVLWDFPVGLAAGLDKNAEAIDFFSSINFGAIEVGTVTPKEQEGNTKPRMFRYPSEKSLRNCMGFNNEGSDFIFDKVRESERNSKVLGVNLGKNKNTPVDQASDDYQFLYWRFYDVSDYLVINISSPNTPGLRDLQKQDALKSILDSLVDLRDKNPVPLYVKLSPDLNYDDLPGIVQLAKEYKLEGLIATNTTIMEDRGVGGISGKLLRSRAKKLRGALLELLRDEPSIQLIGVGGISCFDDLWDFWKQGGKVVQIYTSFIYQGPQILTDIRNEIDNVLEINNYKNLSELLRNITTAKRN